MEAAAVAAPESPVEAYANAAAAPDVEAAPSPEAELAAVASPETADAHAPLPDADVSAAPPAEIEAAAAPSPEAEAAIAPPIPPPPPAASEVVVAPTPPPFPQQPAAESLAAPRPSVPSRPSELPSSVSLLPPPAALGARIINSIPPHWLVLARKHPASWMVGAPVALASLLVLALLVAEPPRKTPEPRMASSAAALATLEPAAAAAPPAADAQPAAASLADLEAKPADSLSVAELLQLNQARAQRKRADAQALSHKLEQQPDLANDEAVQAQLWRLATDPDTADVALGAMARAHAPIGADLLYEVWTSRAVAPATTELARSLLFSHAVRATASPALAVALELRSANSCETVQAALPKALNDGDRRSLSSLAKLNSHRACDAKNTSDCNPCVSGPVKPVVAAVGAVKRRPAPHYPTR